MELTLKRVNSSRDDTFGNLYINGKYQCMILEDEKRAVKVYGETRIPAGIYEIKLRTEGGHHKRYKDKYPTHHKGMLHLQNVPNFKYILIHIGNTDDDTAGCLLPGHSLNDNVGFDKANIGHSALAYEAMYKKVVKALEDKEQVFIKIQDEAI